MNKPALLCAAAAVALLPGTAQAQAQVQAQPARPAPGEPTPAPSTDQPAGAISQSDPTDAGSQPTPDDGSLGDNAPAQEAAPGDPEAPGEVADIVVTGFRSSLQAGLDLKREAITIRDSIVAEDIGKFPEANVAESLQRVPGVELVRDGNSNEGQTIRLRGLPSSFTVTTFNGSPVYTTSSGGVGNASRTFNYDVFPSELFGRVDVYKAPLAELTEGGIAGVVDLQTPRPFDQRADLVVRYAASVNYNSQSGDYSPRGNFLVSAKSGNFGALISVAGARIDNGRAGFSSTGNYSGARTGNLSGVPVGNSFSYNFDAPGANIGSLTQAQVNNAILPRFLSVGVGKNRRERLGGAASLQYKDDRLDLSLDGLYSVVTDDNVTAEVRWPIRDSNNGIPANATNQLALIPLDVRIDENNNLQGRLGNVQFNYADFFDQSETKYKYLALNGSYELTDKLKLSGQVAVSDSRAFRNNITLSGDSRQLRHELTFDTTNPFFPTITTNRDLLDPATYFTFNGPAYGGGYREEEDRLKSGRLVLDWDYDFFGVQAHLKAGVAYNENTKVLEVRATNNLYNGLTIPGVGLYGAPTTTLAQRNAFITSFLKPLSVTDFVPGAPSSLPQNYLAFDRDFAYNTLNAVSVNRAAPFNLGSTYRAVEEIKAAFIQSDFDGDLFGRRMRINMGVRLVETNVDINNNRLASGGTFAPNVSKSTYRRLLPSVTLAYDVLDNLVVRAAAGKTFTRAAIQDIAADLSLPAGGAGNLFLNAGNPDLRPEFATSLDGSAEWYFAKGGVLSIAAYKKTLNGRAVRVSRFQPFNELGIPSSIFTANIQRDLEANPALLVEIRTPVNLAEYSLNGIELAYQQAFTFLPAPFDGLGAIASVTRVTTDGLDRVYPALGGDPAVTVALNDVPETTYQVSGYYEKEWGSIRVSYNHRTDVANIGQTATNPLGFQRFANARGYLDATASYRLTDWLELRVDVSNILETKTYDFFRNVRGLYGDEQSRIEGFTQSGRVINFGIRGSF